MLIGKSWDAFAAASCRSVDLADLKAGFHAWGFDKLPSAAFRITVIRSNYADGTGIAWVPFEFWEIVGK